MCGIAGFVHLDKERKASEQRLLPMREALLHRGPDSAGSWTQANIALAHRRLAIIDTSDAGHQPMHSADKRLSIVFNGEIYNYQELRQYLTTKGHSFRTESDTEVLLASYREWSTDCVQHFNGVWAFALYDHAQDLLFCSRDRMGEKPFFYTTHDNSFAFASEIKSLFAFGAPAAINTEMLDSYLCFTYIPAPHSFFTNIFKLEAGCSMIVRDGNVHVQRYWDVPLIAPAEQRADEANILKEFEELFYDSVKLRMRSDVPFGAFLSGGLDSASIVRAMSEVSTEPIQTFTAGFADRAFDERDLAQLVATQCATNHRSFEIEMSNAEELLQTIAELYDEPFGDSSALPSYLIAAEAKKYVTVILTGDGGDEVLSGYTIHQGEKFAQHYQNLPSMLTKRALPAGAAALRSIAPGGMKHKMRRVEEVLRASSQSFEHRIMAKQNGFRSTERSALASSLVSVSAEEVLQDRLSAVSTADPFTKLNYWLTKVALPDDMLTKVDRATMAHALEARLPFLDHRLVELMWSVRMDIRLKGFQRKYVLRSVMGPRLPQELLKAPKSGFVLPLRTWLQPERNSSLRKRILRSGDSGLVQTQAITEVFRAHDSSERDAANALWSLGILHCVSEAAQRSMAETTQGTFIDTHSDINTETNNQTTHLENAL